MTSTTRSTAGSGFDFEDQVAAWIMLDMLHGHALWGSSGNGTRLQMQVKALGWLIDDILVATGTAPNDQQFRALSCKSSKQVTAEKLPADFITACWQQWLKPGANPFRRERDGIVLVTRGRNADFMATWTEVKAYARSSDPLLALARLQETGKFQTMFSSVKSPAKDAGFEVEDQDVLALIRAINVLPLDLQVVESHDAQLAIERSRLLLKGGSVEAARSLWFELIDLARNTRLGSGTLNLADVLAHLRGRFFLQDHPNYSKSWATLRTFSTEVRSQIETTLSSGLAIDRADDERALIEMITGATVSVIFGDSGSGKSALLKAVLDKAFSDAEQVWLDPSGCDTLLSQVARVTAGLDQPLPATLRQSAARIVLILDAAERLSPESEKKAMALVRELEVTGDQTEIRIVIVGQTDAWVGGRLQELAGSAAPVVHEVKALSSDAVRQVLRATSGLSSLALDGSAVLALTNLRTLSWVVQAASQFQMAPRSSGLSLTAIVDRLWNHWTDSKASVQRLLMRLAEREASFEHSFAISELEGDDVAAFDERPNHCPLKRDPTTGRVRFAHALASDWARFQRLRELSDEVSKWQSYAGNPFWYGPIRMLGQHLLRVRAGEQSAWVVAFEAAEQNRKAAPLADDLLLDALFLDPDAEMLLEGQAELLLGNDGRRLLRLIRRFEHIASEPRARPAPGSRFSDLSLYMEAEFRTPIYARWPPMARFLSRHRDQVAAMMSPDISKLCDRWLAGTPVVLTNGQPMPFRLEFAQLALAVAREVQTALAKGNIIGLHDDAKPIFRAALAGGQDLQQEVSAWALEMCGRRSTHEDVLLRVTAHRQQEAAEHTRRIETDAEYRERHERLKNLPGHISSSRKLPPWPLGPQRRIESSFREVALAPGALSALMHSAPDVAGEVLLACIIEDQPVEEYRSHLDLDHELGIEFDHDSYPTAPWKSPFLLFLSINAKAALSALIQLVNFATDRWAHALHKADGTAPSPVLLLNLEGSNQRRYCGYGWVFNWSHDNSNFIGMLHSSLAAFERWLCETRERHAEQVTLLDLALRTSHSSAVIGVLSNLAKFDQKLLRGPLRFLAGSQYVHLWDSQRVESDRWALDLNYWARSGEMIFEMAKQWLSRPYRRAEFTDIVCGIVAFDESFGEFILGETAQWVAPEPEETKSAIEFAVLRARLDYRNYEAQQTPEGHSGRKFVCPPDVLAAVQEFQAKNSLALEVLSLPEQCRKRLSNPAPLEADEAAHLAATLRAIDTETNLDLDRDMKARARAAAACALALRGTALLEKDPRLAKQVEEHIQREVDATWEAPPDDGPGPRGSPSPLQFAAWIVVERWVQQPSRASETMLLKVLLSGDESAVATIFFAALGHRVTLGPRWWRLLHIAMIWSGLLMLKPRYGDEDSYSARWQRWRHWLAGRSLSVAASIESIKPIPIAEAVGRVDFLHARRRHLSEEQEALERPAVPWHGGLHGGVLEPAFAWLIKASESADTTQVTLAERKTLFAALWEHQAWWLRGSAKENGDFPVSGQFAYEVVTQLASIARQISEEEAANVWKPILDIGPNGHYLISHFLGSWFLQLSERTSAHDFAPRWRGLIEFVVLDATWTASGPYYHRESLTRTALGFHHPDSIVRLPGHASLIASMKNLYQAWAAAELAGAEENLSEFCYFLAHEAGKALRLEGLTWIVAAKAAKPELSNWYRSHTSSNFIDFLNMLVAEHGATIQSNQTVKAALLDLATLAAAKQLKASMQLLERIRRL